ncbi:MAG: hypothetical protein ACJ8GW_05225 [Massilia sp.]
MKNAAALALVLFGACLIHVAANAASCPARDMGASATSKAADWVIEATVVDVLMMDGADQPTVVVEGLRVLQANDAFPKVATLTLAISPCDTEDLKIFRSKASAQVLGKKMRFYGNNVTDKPRWRFYFMETASKPFKLVP